MSETDDAGVESAAVMIQSAIRGKLARMQVAELKQSGNAPAHTDPSLRSVTTEGGAAAAASSDHQSNAGGGVGGAGGASVASGSVAGQNAPYSSNAGGYVVPVGEEGLDDFDGPIVPFGEEGLDEFDGPIDDGYYASMRNQQHGGMADNKENDEEDEEDEDQESDRENEKEEGLVAKQAQLATYYEQEEQEDDEGPTFEMLMSWYEDAMIEKEKLTLHNSLLQHRIYENMVKRKQAEEKRELDGKALAELDQRYNRILSAIDEQHNELSRIQALSDRIVADLKERVDERNGRANDLRREVKTFKQGVFETAENSRTGKEIPEKVIVHFVEKDDEREGELSQVRLKNIAFRNQLKKLEGSLKAKEELAEGLHLIDFEQLKIENQTFNEKIEERNEELLKLRKKTTQTVQVLTHAKEKLQYVQAENQDLRLELAELEQEVNRQRDYLNRIKRERDTLRAHNLSIRQDSGKVSTELLAKDYELGKIELEGMRQIFAELKSRHIELTEQIQKMARHSTLGINATASKPNMTGMQRRWKPSNTSAGGGGTGFG